MPKFTAKAYLVHNGELVKKGEELELTNEQAKRLGDKVGILMDDGSGNVDAQDGEESLGDVMADVMADVPALDEKSVADLKEIARAYEIEGYSKMNKGQLVEAIQERL